MKILAIRLHALGDVVITLPYLNSLKRSSPESELDFLTGGEAAPIPRSLTLFSRVFVIDGGRSFKRQCLSTAFLLPRLLLQRYDVVLDLQNNELSRFVTSALRPEKRCRFDRTGPLPAGERTRLAIESSGLGSVGIDTDLPTRDEAAALALLRRNGYEPEDRLVILNPAGAFPSRNWPLPSYVRFARAFQELDSRPVKFLLLGLPSLAAKASSLRSELDGQVIDLVGRTTAEEVFSLVRKADLVLSEDSGLMHMGWVSGVPTLALFGSSRGRLVSPARPAIALSGFLRSRMPILHGGGMPLRRRPLSHPARSARSRGARLPASFVMMARMDRPTLYAAANRLWGSAGGLLTAALVASFFTPELQGYYFTFASLLTLQTFVELGFGELLQQFVSHEWAKTSSGQPEERERALSRLAGLLRFSLRWYGGCALVLGAVLGVAGSLYFRIFSHDEAIAWELPWWTAVAVTALSILLAPWFSLLEGANRVERVHGVRLAQGIASRVAGFLAIVFGWGLFTVALTRIVSFVLGVFGLGRESLAMVRRLRRHRGEGETVSYRRELWPLQWRYALSWLSGYLLYSLFTPLLFAFHGPEVAGRMGMTVAAATAITSAAFAFMATKVPRLAILAAERDYPAMDALFRRATASSVLVSGAGAAIFLASLALARALDLSIASRFLPMLDASLFLCALVLQQVRFAMGSYLRAHKSEPFAPLAVAEALAAVPLLTLAARAFGARGMILAFFGLTLLTLVPAVQIFRRCRRNWHSFQIAEREARRAV